MRYKRLFAVGGKAAGSARRFLTETLVKTVPHALILLYHRVSDENSDPQLLKVRSRHFDEQLQVLRKHHRVVHLQELAARLNDCNVPNGSVVVTFDDGYRDNLQCAKPLLEKNSTPATVFVTAGYDEQSKEFWWDELERLLLHSPSRQKHLTVDNAGDRYDWSYGRTWEYVVADASQSWNVLSPDDPTSRHRAYRELHALLRPLNHEQRESVMEQIRSQIVGVNAERRKMTPGEIRVLAESGLVEIGAHTATHPVLSTLSGNDQRTEILLGKSRLEYILGHPVSTFSYPYGGRCDYTPETVDIVQKAGFSCACSNFPGIVWKMTDRFQLPRVLVRDWDGEEFTRRLRKWFHG